MASGFKRRRAATRQQHGERQPIQRQRHSQQQYGERAFSPTPAAQQRNDAGNNSASALPAPTSLGMGQRNSERSNVASGYIRERFGSTTATTWRPATAPTPAARASANIASGFTANASGDRQQQCGERQQCQCSRRNQRQIATGHQRQRQRHEQKHFNAALRRSGNNAQMPAAVPRQRQQVASNVAMAAAMLTPSATAAAIWRPATSANASGVCKPQRGERQETPMPAVQPAQMSRSGTAQSKAGGTKYCGRPMLRSARHSDAATGKAAGNVAMAEMPPRAKRATATTSLPATRQTSPAESGATAATISRAARLPTHRDEHHLENVGGNTMNGGNRLASGDTFQTANEAMAASISPAGRIPTDSNGIGADASGATSRNIALGATTASASGDNSSNVAIERLTRANASGSSGNNIAQGRNANASGNRQRQCRHRLQLQRQRRPRSRQLRLRYWGERERRSQQQRGGRRQCQCRRRQQQ